MNKRVIHVLREPGPDGYTETFTVGREGRIAPLAFPGDDLAGADLLG